MPEFETRATVLIAGVIREAIRAANRDGVVILDDGSPEARLLVALCLQSLGDAHVWAARLETNGNAFKGEESLRLAARVLAAEKNALTAHPANKTALLLGREIPPEPLLPLGDLYATQIEALAGSWSGPPEVLVLADQVSHFPLKDGDGPDKNARGIDRLDAALRAMFEERRPVQDAVADLPELARGPFLEAVRRGRFWRERAGLIPKLSTRTIGIDLFA